MAIVRVFGGKSYNANYKGTKYKNKKAVKKVVNYMFREGEYGDSDLLTQVTGGYGVNLKDSETIVQDMELVKDLYGKNNGRQLQHLAICLNKEESEMISDLREFGYDICRYFGEEYQTVFAGHGKENGVHIHVCVNSVGFKTGRKFSDRNGGLKRFKRYVEETVEEYCKPKQDKMEV